MPKSHGKERRALKQRKRRDARRKARTGRTAAESRAPAGQRLGVGPGQEGLAGDGLVLPEPGHYHPDHPPEPAGWLALTDAERVAQVERFHERALPPKRRPPSLRTHAGVHVIVETQLAEQDPPAIAAALERLVQGGLRRHDAVHAVGWVVAEHMKQAVGQGRQVDRDAYVTALDELSVERWRALAQGSQASR